MLSPWERCTTEVQKAHGRPKTGHMAEQSWPSGFQGQGTWPALGGSLENSDEFITVSQLL